ncbi:head-to-tail stopper [Arthrobacter phage VroomVroom]|uniref:Head-to-tail stopper n=1 Tax=Arthrobacter phage VroomVroom TaxID=3049371 RepID=A0AA49IPX5_9CAUD|nr:head-to-tail stopper [Arthrobacter phage VroomVroom]
MLLNDYRLPPVYRLRAGITEDSYGDPVESWDTPDKVRLKRAVVQFDQSAEDEDTARRILRTERVLIVPGVVDLTAEDRIEYKGETWKIQGEPATREGFAQDVYTVAILTQTQG